VTPGGSSEEQVPAGKEGDTSENPRCGEHPKAPCWARNKAAKALSRARTPVRGWINAAAYDASTAGHPGTADGILTMDGAPACTVEQRFSAFIGPEEDYQRPHRNQAPTLGRGNAATRWHINCSPSPPS
jgi:hypothetical protein